MSLLSETTLEHLAATICREALLEREVNYQRLVLTQHPDFVPLNMFKLLSTTTEKPQDRGVGGGSSGSAEGIASLDIVQFMMQNGQVISESDAYLLISQFDSNKDGKLSFIE